MLESLRSVEHFLDENADKLASVVNTGARQRLTAAITDLSAHASEQTGSNLAAQGRDAEERGAPPGAAARSHGADRPHRRGGHPQPAGALAVANAARQTDGGKARELRVRHGRRGRASPTRSPRPDSAPTSSRS
jgi:hypothetical protein